MSTTSNGIKYTSDLAKTASDVATIFSTLASDLLTDGDFLSRTIGMSSSYSVITTLLQSLGHEPTSLLGKDYLYIFDHVKRNYLQGTDVYDDDLGCPKFTFYKDKPTVRFADPYNDAANYLGGWVANMSFGDVIEKNIEYFYAESNDEWNNNKSINSGDSKNQSINANGGIAYGGNVKSFGSLSAACGLLQKTNAKFNKGKYRTLVARFHTNSEDSKDTTNQTQTAISIKYGMSHGRNLLKKTPNAPNGYDNPYCRVWTYHHQYHTMADTIRPFEVVTAKSLETEEGGSKNVSFRTKEDSNYNFFHGGSSWLDDYGVLDRGINRVTIAPTAKIVDYTKNEFLDKAGGNDSIKRCMFSIENLAWRDENTMPYDFDNLGLSAEQKGPLGGRIMWFPPYDINFSEDVRVKWNSNEFIGRGESVYTYTNTERNGNLSFMLLIDHPSIIDYWNRSKKDGSTSAATNYANSVDDKNSDEQTLLRFFAGCEILTAKPQTYTKKEVEPEKVEEPIAINEPDAVETEQKTICCILYFPNNYTGVDDAPSTTNSIVNAVDYLVNGIGTQKYIGDDAYAHDFAAVTDSKVTESGFGGYEIRKDAPISLNVKPLNENLPFSAIASTYADTKSKERKGQYFTDENANIARGGYENGQLYDLAKIVGSKALSLASAKNTLNLTGSHHIWYRRRWYYRLDSAYENDRLSTKESYIDTNSFGLNSSVGYADAEGSKIATPLNLNDEDTTLIAFTDLYVALNNNDSVKNVLNGCYDEANVQTVQDIINGKNGISINSIEINGHASKQGYSTRNDTLAKNRANTLKNWLNSMNFPSISNATIGSLNTQDEEEGSHVDYGFNSEEDIKIWRSASVKITYTQNKIVDASKDNEVAADSNGNINQNSVSIPNKISSEDGKATRLAVKPISISDSIQQTSINEMTKKIQSVRTDSAEDSTDLADNEAYKAINAYTQNSAYDRQDDMFRKMSQMSEAKRDQSTSDSDQGQNPTETAQYDVNRYDNEGEFFQRLTRDKPFLHHLISEKIKYFDPAFHSISPEGFNARLTFLHQCTRQGSTVENDNGFKSTAYNLAFGRPPVCVLRLGDFYYTKIIINSLSIQYESPQWDLNPEGIGVMPMFAKVNMSFTFLGGSDLAGPISRLQNAVSFNYYANTSVYDNRAESVKYSGDKSGKETDFKPFVYPKMKSISWGDSTISSVNDSTDNKWVGQTYK